MDARTVERLSNAHILVVGDVLLDRFVDGAVGRISREAPVPVLKRAGQRAAPGGACNVAANVLSCGGRATLVGLTGDDDAARELLALCAAFPGMTPRFVTDPDRPTTVKTRYLSGWQQLLCVDTQDNTPAPAAAREAMLAAATEAMVDAGALVISDYGRGALDRALIGKLIDAARNANVPVIVDPRRDDPSTYDGAALVTPNLGEMERFTGRYARDDEAAVAACRDVLAHSTIEAVLLTRGAAGMTLVQRDPEREPLHVQAETHEVFDVTGAGDTVIAVLAAALASGTAIGDAVRLANLAAGIVVAKPGTATVHPRELLLALGQVRARRVADRAEAAETAALWSGLGLTVGFTNGCFDLLHRGHLHSLEQAAARCDRLIVGLNSDASTSRLKGPARPVQDQDARAAILAALRPVDLVVVFDEDTPENLIRAVRPQVLLKGADYEGKDVPGADFVRSIGGEVALLPLLDGFSTTGTIRRIEAAD